MALLPTHPLRHNASHNDIHNIFFNIHKKIEDCQANVTAKYLIKIFNKSLIFIKQLSFYARSMSQSSSGLKKPVKHLQSAPELHWLKFTQNDFFEKLVLTHPPTFWPGVGNFFFCNPLA